MKRLFIKATMQPILLRTTNMIVSHQEIWMPTYFKSLMNRPVVTSFNHFLIWLQEAKQSLVPNTKTTDDAILQISTFRRKRSKVKKSKLKQRRKKLRRLSEAKRIKRNY